ncbi:MAG TPA: SCP2 sterol-binding domain-containing protein [Alphaproteobacteria bacterium]|nr:SCP2 sterol-binding domain-containing protein [Alphaproteobacteria bacterium]
MTLDEATTAIRGKVAQGFDITSKVKIDLGSDGAIFIDGTASPATVDNSTSDADVTIITDMDVFDGILGGSQNAQMAFMTGKLKVDGDMSVAMKMAQFL